MFKAEIKAERQGSVGGSQEMCVPGLPMLSSGWMSHLSAPEAAPQWEEDKNPACQPRRMAVTVGGDTGC